MMLFITIFLLSFALYCLGGVFYYEKKSLITDVYSHVAFPGVVLAYLLFNSLDLYLVLFVTTAFVLLMDFIKNKLLRITKFTTDSIFAFFIAFGFSLGTLLINILQNYGVSTKVGFSDFLFGNISAISSNDSILIVSISSLILCVLYIYRRVIKNYLFDKTLFSQLGFNVSFVQRLLSVCTVVLCVLSLKVAGVVLTTGLFLIPFATANLFYNKIKHLFVFALLLISLVTLASIFISLNFSGLSTGPILIVLYFVVYLFSQLCKCLRFKNIYG